MRHVDSSDGRYKVPCAQSGSDEQDAVEKHGIGCDKRDKSNGTRLRSYNYGAPHPLFQGEEEKMCLSCSTASSHEELKRVLVGLAAARQLPKQGCQTCVLDAIFYSCSNM
jgi:hypothetical protein